MNIIYKKLTENELDIFIAMRINQLREEGATEDIDLEPALMDLIYGYQHQRTIKGLSKIIWRKKLYRFMVMQWTCHLPKNILIQL